MVEQSELGNDADQEFEDRIEATNEAAQDSQALQKRVEELEKALNDIADSVESWAVDGVDSVEYFEEIGKRACAPLDRELKWD